MLWPKLSDNFLGTIGEFEEGLPEPLPGNSEHY